jgi:hypothetical protein
MQGKPRVLQRRPGFHAAVVEAAERVLAGDADDKQQEIAILAKLEYLHRDVDKKAVDARLKAFVQSLSGDKRDKVAAQVRFHALEYRALGAAALSADEIRALLADVKAFFETVTPTQRHMRLASATVAAIKRLDEGKEREKHYRSLGGMLAESQARSLQEYGASVLELLQGDNARDSRPHEYWTVCEAVFRYQFQHNASAAQQRAKAYFLTVRGSDPPAEFLRRFARHTPPVKRGSQFRAGGGLQFRIDSFKWTGDNTAEVRGGYYEGNLSASGNTFRVQKTDSGWKVTGRSMSWIS